MNWDAITKKVSDIVNTVEPLVNGAVGILAPELSVAVSLGEKLIHGIINAEPAAVALVDSIKGGAVPTPAELQAFADTYEDSYQKLKADIAAKLAE
jgi:hypothetical protein